VRFHFFFSKRLWQKLDVTKYSC